MTAYPPPPPAAPPPPAYGPPPPAYGPPPPAYGAPPPAYGPPPPAIIVIAAPSETLRGVKSMSTTLLLYMIFNVLVFVAAILILVALLPLLGNPNPTPAQVSAAIAALVGAAGALCAMIIVGLVALIMFILAVVRIRAGRNEFGPDHAASAETGTLMIVLGLIIIIFGGGGMSQAGLGIVAAAAAGGLVSLIGGVVFALGMVKLVSKIANEDEKKKLQLFFYLTIAAGILGMVVGLVFAIQISSGAVGGATSVSGIGSILTLVAVLFAWQAYKSIGQRIESGQLRPAMPGIVAAPIYAAPPPQYGAPPPPPQYGVPPPPPP